MHRNALWGIMHFTARYVYGYDDYKMVLEAARPLKRYGFWPFRLGVLAILLAFDGLDWLVSAGSDTALDLGARALMLLPFVLFYAVWEIGVFHSRYAYKKSKLAGKELTYEIGESGISWQRGGASGVEDWSVCETIATFPGGATLLAAKKQWVVLPARAFASQREFEAATAFIQAKLAGAKGQTQATAQTPPSKGVGAESATYTARFVFSLDDFGRLMDAVQPEGIHGRLRAPAMLVMFLLFCAPGASEAARSGLSPAFWDWARTEGWLAVLTGAAFVYFSSPLLRRSQYRHFPLAGREMISTLSGKGVSWSGQGMHSQFVWAEFTGLKASRSALVLAMGKQGVVLPVRAFASRQELEAASAFARAKIGGGAG
jgi:hypothetical protein